MQVFKGLLATQPRNPHNKYKCKYKGENNILASGALLLKDSNWEQLRFLDIGLNNLFSEGCKYLVEMEWPNLEHLNIRTNMIIKV